MRYKTDGLSEPRALGMGARAQSTHSFYWSWADGEGPTQPDTCTRFMSGMIANVTCISLPDEREKPTTLLCTFISHNATAVPHEPHAQTMRWSDSVEQSKSDGGRVVERIYETSTGLAERTREEPRWTVGEILAV